MCEFSFQSREDLRIPDSYDAKIAKIAKFCNFWSFWPVIQLINHLYKIWQKGFLKKVHICEKYSDIFKVASV